VLRTITGAGNVPNVPMYLIIHTAIGGFAGGTPNPATFPQTMEVDYARITV
jgi:beta-glucanase (GH16 family)